MGGGKKKNTSNNRQQQHNNASSKPMLSEQNEVSQFPNKGERDLTKSQTPEKAAAHSSGSILPLTKNLTDLFNVTVDCLTLHLILAMSKQNMSAEMKELVKSVVDLKITNSTTQMAGSSQTINSNRQSGPEQDTNRERVAEQSNKSKEEVLAERKAKAAEAKARKAAAAATRKEAKEGPTWMDGAQPQTVDRNKKQEGGKTQEKAARGGSPKEQKQKGFSRKAIASEEITKVNGSEAVKSAISSGTYSSRPSQPFKRVHFDMTPSEGNGTTQQRQRHPSLTDVPTANVHPAFLNFAARCEAKEIVGIDAVCVAFIHAFKEFLSEYKMNENRKMSHDLDQAIRPHFSYLTQNGSQPFPLALGNLIRQLKKEINQLPDNISELDGKNKLLEWLSDFCSQNFDLALRAISSFCLSKMESTRYILTYSWCPVVERVLLDAYEQKLSLHVCVLDSPVEPRGRRLAKTLCCRNIECTYGMLSAIGYVMKRCRLVLLGCSAILSNGFVVADRGASQVALVAAAANVPVLIAAQTLKFVDRVQTFDRSIREVSALVGERQETIPADLVTAVVTELRIVPPSSAPAVLKAKQLAVG